MPISNRRRQLIYELCLRRQTDFGLILEHVFDLHNVSAVVRSCDAVGIPAVHLVHHPIRAPKDRRIGKFTSSGARKWVDVYQYDQLTKALDLIDIPDAQILVSHLSDDAKPFDSIDLTKPSILIMGNEKSGVSEEALSYADHQVCLPQFGMVESLNISVACGMMLYEMSRQRREASLYDRQTLSDSQLALFDTFLATHNKPRGRELLNPGNDFKSLC